MMITVSRLAKSNLLEVRWSRTWDLTTHSIILDKTEKLERWSLSKLGFLTMGECKSLLFLLVNLVTVSVHCSNYIARRHQIHTSCITKKDKGVWLRKTGRNKQFDLVSKSDEKVILIFCGEQYWCVIYCHLYDVQYGEYAGTTVVCDVMAYSMLSLATSLATPI